MFTKKTPLLLVFIILGTTTDISGASLRQLDSVGRMPEITVTAPRYEYQDEAWSGMLDEVVVEAQRPSSSANIATAGDKSTAIVSGRESSKGVDSVSRRFGDSVYLFISLTLIFVTLSISYMSLSTCFVAKEVKQ